MRLGLGKKYWEYQIDVEWDCPIGELYSFMDRYEARIKRYITNGPAGGNPLITFTFKTKIARDRFINAWKNLGSAQVMVIKEQ